VRRIHLLSRSAHSYDAPSLVSFLSAAGSASITVSAADIGAAADVRWALGPSGMGSGALLRDVVHAGGVLADAAIPNQSLDGLRRVHAAKVRCIVSPHSSSSKNQLPGIDIMHVGKVLADISVPKMR
jgi:hypothetical protein